jgi:tetratricopeptide (TPR) repeat protein
MAQNLTAALSLEQLLSSAEDAWRNGLFAAAESVCADVLAKHPANARALFIRGACFVKRGNMRPGLRDLEKAAQVAPGDPAILLELCRGLLANGAAPAAEKRLREAVAHVPGNNAEMLRDFAELFMRLGHHGEAIPMLDKALLANPTDAAAFNMRGYALQQLGDHPRAVGNFTRALVLQPGLHHASNNRGNSLQALGRFAEALKDYDSTLAIDPAYVHAWTNRAKALQQMGREEEARASSARAAALAQRPAAANGGA